MKIAITHDYLIDFGGAERVLLALHEIYPEAPIYVSILNKKGLGEHWKEFEKINIKTSWFNHLPFASKLISPLRFLLPLIWRSFGLSGYDLIIDSSSWAITRGFKTRKNPSADLFTLTIFFSIFFSTLFSLSMIKEKKNQSCSKRKDFGS